MRATVRRHLRFLVGGLVLALASGGLFLQADDSPKKSDKDAATKAPAAKKAEEADSSKPATAKAERKPLRCEVVLKGFFEADKMTEVSVRTEANVPLSVASVVEPGSAVKKGDVILTFNSEKVDREIRDLEAEKALAELTVKQAEEELPLLERAMPLELALATKLKNEASENLDYFLKTDKAWDEKSAKFMVKNTNDYLEYAKEELKQLQKMYRNKDLTEETEEIILKRQRNWVEQMAFYVDEASVQRDQTLMYRIPRREKTLREDAEKTALALEKAKTTLPLNLSQKRLALAKSKYDRTKAAEHLDRLRRDREALTVKAPADGVVYYGRCLRGQWITTPEVSKKLVRGGVIQADEAFYTIVDPNSLFVRATVEEKDLAAVTPGAAAKVTPTAQPDSRLPARVRSVLGAPLGAGVFDARLELEGGKGSALTAGMACSVKLVPYRKADALSVPVAAVFHDDDEPYVYVDVAGQPKKQTVKTGHTASERVEILEGLHDGDVVRLSKP